MLPDNNSTLIIFCSERQGTEPTQARLLYKSSRFIAQRDFAEALNCKYFILSGKYGLISPESIISPYDKDLNSADLEYLEEWKHSVSEKVSASIENDSGSFYIFANETYETHFKQAISRTKLNPPHQINMDISSLNDLSKRIIKRREALNTFYSLVDRRGLRLFSTALSTDIPKQGTYYFFDSAEKSAISAGMPRLVRVGTHAVSAGSKSTMRQRLRTHYGTSAGTGNHRSSIFRLHVGECLQLKGDFERRVPSWGNVNINSSLRDKLELELELRVSDYIKNLYVCWNEIAGESSKNNERAAEERYIIDLASSEGIAIDQSSPSWLGRSSSRQAIRRFGLWNVQQVARPLLPSQLVLV